MLSTVELQELKDKYGKYFEPIKSDSEFLKIHAKLDRIGAGDKNTAEFHNIAQRLLEYVHRTENGKQALLLTKTLNEIRVRNKFFLTNNATNVDQLCDLILIQFKHSLKPKIYYNIMKLLNYCEGWLGNFNINSVVGRRRIDDLEGNIFECFNLKLSLEHLHTYLVLGQEDELRKLYLDLEVEWDKLDHQVNEKTFEKFLWYSFILDKEKGIQEHITHYKSLIKSNRWGVKFYRYVTKTFSENGSLNKEKMQKLIKRFKKMKGYSIAEKERIIIKILKKIKEKQVTNEVERLVSYHLPKDVKLKDVNQELNINLAVYENKEMKNILRTISVEAISHPKREDIYINRRVLKRIIEENAPGYIHVLEGRRSTSKENADGESDWFVWPSTEITGDGENDANGLKKKSELIKIGYQITGKTREQRWRILQRAVPVIGLKKVAYTIAGNVKLRKGQKNGVNKFSYAISEWEHDLAKLKKVYYKKDFNWPST